MKLIKTEKMPIGILNMEGYFDLLLGQIQYMVKEGFVRESNLELFVVSDAVDSLLEQMGNHKTTLEDKWL